MIHYDFFFNDLNEGLKGIQHNLYTYFINAMFQKIFNKYLWPIDVIGLTEDACPNIQNIKA